MPNRRRENILWFAICTLANSASYSLAFFTSQSWCSNALLSFSVNLYLVSSQPALLHGDVLSWHGTGHFPLLNSMSFLQTHFFSLSMSVWWTAALPYQSGRTGLQTCKLCSLQTCWEYTPPLSLLVCKDTKHYVLYYGNVHGKMTLAPICQMAFTWLITNLQAQISQFSTCLIFYIFVWKDSVRGLQTLVHRAGCFILQAIKSVKHKLSLLNPCWLFLSIFLSIWCLKMVSERTCSMIFLETEAVLSQSFLVLLDDDIVLLF